MGKKMGFWGALALVCSFSFPASGTVLLDHSLADLTYLAVKDEDGSGVAVATAGRTWTSWDEDRRFPYTYTEFTLERQVAAKTALPSRFVIKQFGGQIDGVEVRVHGQANFAENEKALLFLRHQGDDLQLVGMSQGKWVVKPDPKSGRELALGDNDGRTLFVRQSKTGLTAPAPKANSSYDLEDLIGEIRALADNLEREGR